MRKHVRSSDYESKNISFIESSIEPGTPSGKLRYCYAQLSNTLSLVKLSNVAYTPRVVTRKLSADTLIRFTSHIGVRIYINGH